MPQTLTIKTSRRRHPRKYAHRDRRKRAALNKLRRYGRGRARPMSRMPNSYKTQSVHRFVRETMPLTLPMVIIPAGASFPAMGSLSFDNLQFNQLVASTGDFGNLFARYKVDKIETILTPMFQEVTAESSGAFMPGNTPALRITRVNTKWLNQPLTLGANSDAVLAELAQMQSKSVTPYASRRSLKLITYNPGVSKRDVLDTTNTEIETNGPAPWLNISNQADVPFKHNSHIFAERTDGQAVTTDWKYRVVHKVYFRCVQVG